MMLKDPPSKYRHFTTVDPPDRAWPGNVQSVAPIWCSLDMRDGNQALIEPMKAERKRCQSRVAPWAAQRNERCGALLT